MEISTRAAVVAMMLCAVAAIDRLSKFMHWFWAKCCPKSHAYYFPELQPNLYLVQSLKAVTAAANSLNAAAKRIETAAISLNNLSAATNDLAGALAGVTAQLRSLPDLVAGTNKILEQEADSLKESYKTAAEAQSALTSTISSLNTLSTRVDRTTDDLDASTGSLTGSIAQVRAALLLLQQEIETLAGGEISLSPPSVPKDDVSLNPSSVRKDNVSLNPSSDE